MSIYNKLFKVNSISESELESNLLMKVTNNKISSSEISKIYESMQHEIIEKAPKESQISEAMKMLNSVKGSYLSTEEKENFIAGVWMFNSMKEEGVSNRSRYINTEQLKYVKQAVLGTQFNAVKNNDYSQKYKEFKANL